MYNVFTKKCRGCVRVIPNTFTECEACTDKRRDKERSDAVFVQFKKYNDSEAAARSVAEAANGNRELLMGEMKKAEDRRLAEEHRRLLFENRKRECAEHMEQAGKIIEELKKTKNFGPSRTMLISTPRRSLE